jgi:nicotinamide riboside kinase
MSAGRVVALLGAESTGKTALAQELAVVLQQQHGLRCTWVGEWLRQWCERAGRTPRPEEQADIAAEQTRRIALAREQHDIVVADTTAVMTAVYSQFLFKDTALMTPAQQLQRSYSLTLVTANDLPWVPDPMIRDGAHVREPVRALVMQALQDAGINPREVRGLGSQRLACALAHVREGLGLY